jgi:hypothetical protein
LIRRGASAHPDHRQDKSPPQKHFYKKIVHPASRLFYSEKSIVHGFYPGEPWGY